MRNPTGNRWSLSRPPTLRQGLWRAVVAVALAAPALCVTKPAVADPVGDKRAEAQRLSNQIAALGNRVSLLSEQYDRAQLHVQDVNAKLAAAQAGITSTDGRLTTARHRVSDMAVQSYMRGGTAHELGMFVPKSTEELSVRDVYVRTIAAGANDAIDALRQAHAQLGDQQAQLAAEQQQAKRALAAADSARTAAAQADRQLRGTLARVQGELIPLVAEANAQRVATVAVHNQSNAHKSSLVGFDPGPLPPPSPGAAGAVAAARSQLGKPYAWGAGGPDAYDCSGLTSWAWGRAGHGLAHSAAAQYDETTHISIASLQPGDLVFYGSPPHHVGIYVGGGQMINALHSGTTVQYDSIYMEGDLIGGGRVN